MTLTVAGLQPHIDREVGLMEGGGPFSLIDIANGAGNAWVNSHRWIYLYRGTVPLTVTAGQDYIVMPSDFGERSRCRRRARSTTTSRRPICGRS